MCVKERPLKQLRLLNPNSKGTLVFLMWISRQEVGHTGALSYYAAKYIVKFAMDHICLDPNGSYIWHKLKYNFFST